MASDQGWSLLTRASCLPFKGHIALRETSIRQRSWTCEHLCQPWSNKGRQQMSERRPTVLPRQRTTYTTNRSKLNLFPADGEGQPSCGAAELVPVCGSRIGR